MKKILIVTFLLSAVTPVVNAIEYTQDETSEMSVIVTDSVVMFGMNLTTIENRLYALAGDELAQESLDAQRRDISYIATREADIETATHMVTMGVLWVLLFSIPTLLIWFVIRCKSKTVMALLILTLCSYESRANETVKQEAYNKFVGAMYESCMETANYRTFCQCQGNALVDLILSKWGEQGIKTREKMLETLSDDNFLKPLHNKSWDMCS